MAIKYRKSLAIIGSAFLTLLVIAPSQAASTQMNSSADSLETTGTIHVISKVVNDNIGTKLPGDFKFTVKHWGTEVVGSPFAGVDGAGVTFVVEPGSYVVSTPVVDGYLGSWSGEGIIAGFVLIEAGEVITITRTSEDIGPFGPYEMYEPIANPTTENGGSTPTTENGGSTPTTENGGTLPNTSSPWFNALAAGLLISAAGAVGLLKSRVFS